MEEESHSLETLLGNESFHRWILGRSGRAEEKYWQKWVKANPDHKLLSEQAAKVLKELKIVSHYATDAKSQWARLESRLKETPPSTLYPFLRKPRVPAWNRALRYAAVVLVILLCGYAYLQFRQPDQQSAKVAMMEVSTNYGQQKTLRLPDGSRIVLAPNSRIRHAADWLSKPVKKLQLDGEAYFDILPKDKKGAPELEIRTPAGIIRDLGTQFNVSTFNRRTSVVLQKGLVTVIPRQAKTKREVRLQPGEMALLSNDNPQVQVKKVNPEVYTSWTTDLLVFDHTPLSQFVQSLKNLYGVQVVVDDPSLLDRELTGAIEKKDLKTMLSAVSRVLSISITQKGQTIFIRK